MGLIEFVKKTIFGGWDMGDPQRLRCTGGIAKRGGSRQSKPVGSLAGNGRYFAERNRGMQFDATILKDRICDLCTVKGSLREPFGCCSRSNTLLKQRCSVAVESHTSLHRRYYFSGSLTRSFSSHVAERAVTGPNIPLHFDSFFPAVLLSVIYVRGFPYYPE